ncbi:MAG: hypothetical protein GKR94_18590 [Gammaproteobacteria bacterium]|nr:hypothetical protein [Gammaproteobacteria bacterium]
MLYEVALNRGNESGLAGLFDRATHLVTRYRQIQAEAYNLNFIFKNLFDDDVYEEGTYPALAMLLLFLNLMQIELYGRMREPSKQYLNWMLFTTIGTFEALFTTGQSNMVRFVNQNLRASLTGGLLLTATIAAPGAPSTKMGNSAKLP